MKEAGLVLILIGIIILAAPFLLSAIELLPLLPGKNVVETLFSSIQGTVWLGFGLILALVGAVMVASED